MRNVYRWVDHTAELELELEADTAEGVLREAAAALAELLGEVEAEVEVERTILVEAADRAALLAAFIEELVFLAESEGLVPRRVGRVELGGTSAGAEVEFRHGDPPHLVKAVTYHRLAFERTEGGYRATAVLDV